MADLIYAQLREDVKGLIKLTEGLTTDTAETIVDNENKTVKVNVLKVPGTFTIQLDEQGNETVTYDGSIDTLWNFYSIISQYVKIVDIIDNLNSDATNRPLSAKQGKALKTLIEDSLLNYYTKTEMTSLLNQKQNNLTWDSAPTQGSSNPVTSGGLFTTLANYVLTSRKIAGINLTSDISEASLSSALFTINEVELDEEDVAV